MDCERTGPVSIEARGIFPNPQGPEYFNTADRFFSRMVYPGGVQLLFFTSLNERMNFQGRSRQRQDNYVWCPRNLLPPFTRSIGVWHWNCATCLTT